MMIFADLLSRCSPLSLASYRQFSRNLPLFLLAKSMELNPLARAEGQRFKRLATEYEQQNLTKQLWRDCELFAPLRDLCESAHSAEQTEASISRLEVLLNLRELSASCWPHRFARLLRSHGALYRVGKGQVSAAKDPRTRLFGDARTLVYLPTDGLFNDICPPALYPGMARASASPALLRTLREGFALLDAADPELTEDFHATVSTIVLTPRLKRHGVPAGERWSYNLRFGYAGGVFLDLHQADRFVAAEGLLHEYLHQRLWQWFELEQPSGCPAHGVLLRSPVTGVKREARVMLHALVIYTAALNLYRRCARNEQPALTLSSWAKKRMVLLVEALPSLQRSLGRLIDPESACGNVLALMRERADTTLANSAVAVTRPRHVARNIPLGRLAPTQTRAMACGILLHQRPLLQNFTSQDDPKSVYLRLNWIAAPDENLSDKGLASATVAIDGMNLVFLKAAIDGKPEILIIELPKGQVLSARQLLEAKPDVCVHVTDAADSDFKCRYDVDVQILAPLRHLRVLSHLDPTRVAQAIEERARG